MRSRGTKDNPTGTSPLLGRATILILSAVLFGFFFTCDSGSTLARIALLGGVAGTLGYLGIGFSTAREPSA